jgi:hypothetical protein
MKMRCKDFVVIEQMIPRKIKSPIDKRTVSQALLITVSLSNSIGWNSRTVYMSSLHPQV